MTPAACLRCRGGIVAVVEIRHASAFVTVAEELHFGRAADRLAIAQPAVSRLIRALEAELDIVLFERSSHHVALTAVGEAILPHARALVRARDHLLLGAAELATGRSGTVRLGTTEGMDTRLAVLLERFAQVQPHVDVELHPGHTPEKLDRLLRGELDLAIVRQPGHAPGVRIEPLWSDPLVAALPAAHSRADRGPIDPASLDLPLLLAPRRISPGVHDTIRAAAGEGARRILPYRGLQEALALIAAGRAWTILQVNTVHETPKIAIRRLPTPASLHVALAWRAGPTSPPLTAFATVALAARDDQALQRPLSEYRTG